MASRSGAIELAGAPTAPSAVAHAKSRAEGALSSITVETLAWGGLVVLAILTRFWELGAKALHHDESLHSYYSWIWAAGKGDYAHDPLMHGPLLFHLNALVYLLFGASDATSRYAPATAGVLVVWLPYLLRGPKFLGRWGALATSALLLISPTIMYQSRYIRHDIYTVAGALLMFICIVRYVDQPRAQMGCDVRRNHCADARQPRDHLRDHRPVRLFLYGAVMFDRLREWRYEHREF